jgi:hypothetical protein
MSVTAAALSAPASSTPVARSSVIPPIPTRGILPIFFFHSEMRGRPCGAKVIIRLGFEGAKKLAFVMGRGAPGRESRQTLPGCWPIPAGRRIPGIGRRCGSASPHARRRPIRRLGAAPAGPRREEPPRPLHGVAGLTDLAALHRRIYASLPWATASSATAEDAEINLQGLGRGFCNTD